MKDLIWHLCFWLLFFANPIKIENNVVVVTPFYTGNLREYQWRACERNKHWMEKSQSYVNLFRVNDLYIHHLPPPLPPPSCYMVCCHVPLHNISFKVLPLFLVRHPVFVQTSKWWYIQKLLLHSFIHIFISFEDALQMLIASKHFCSYFQSITFEWQPFRFYYPSTCVAALLWFAEKHI